MGTARGSVGNGVHKPALSVLINVRRALPSLRPAEQRVAHAVLADPAGISESSITAVARMCDTSETTVLRFCRAIGLAGYPELRIALARAAQFEEIDHAGGPPLNGTISATDGLADVVAKIAHADARAIEDTAATLDLNALKGAIDALLSASRIDIYGVGASGLVGHFLHQKLHRIGLVSYVATEAQLALTSAELLGPGDVALGITHTGVTAAVVDALQVAQPTGRDDDRGDQLRPVAGGRPVRPDPDHRRAGDDLPGGFDGEPDHPARGGGLPVRRCGPAGVRRLDRRAAELSSRPSEADAVELSRDPRPRRFRCGRAGRGTAATG